MGDRTVSYYDCPNCNTVNGVEIYDAPSCRLYIEECKYCDFKVDIDYYELEKNHLLLLTPVEARERGIVPYCDKEE